MSTSDTGKMELWSETVFRERMRHVGEESYYDKHPFHLLLNDGRLHIDAIRCWIRNRFYYQSHIPIKDACVLANFSLCDTLLRLAEPPQLFEPKRHREAWRVRVALR